MLTKISISNSLMALTCHVWPGGKVDIRVSWPNHEEEIELSSVKEAITYLSGMAWFADTMLPLLKEIQKGD